MAKKKPKERKKLSKKVITAVLTEAGYRCALPTCRGILAIDLHHIWEVNAGGGNDPSNLIALSMVCRITQKKNDEFLTISYFKYDK